MAILSHKKDHFGGVVIDETALPATQAEFTTQLSASLAAWRRLSPWDYAPCAVGS